MVRREPPQSRPHAYECFVCGHRESADQHPVECPACGGAMKNVTKAQL